MSGIRQKFRLLFDQQQRELDQQQRELARLSSLARYTPGSFIRNGKELSFPDARSFAFIYKEIFNENIYRFNSEKVAPFIIDCGANIGMSVIYFKELFPDAEVIAFEPEREIAKFLEKNITAMDLEKVTLVKKAVWKEDGSLMFLNEGADASRISSVGDMDATKSSYEVEAVRLSRYIDREVDLLKLDIEGAETEVLREIEGKLGHVRRLFIEYHSPENGAQELDDILRILSRNHFRYYIDCPFRMRRSPFVDRESFLSFDFFLNIFAERIS